MVLMENMKFGRNKKKENIVLKIIFIFLIIIFINLVYVTHASQATTTTYTIGTGVYGDYDDSTGALTIRGSGTIDYDCTVDDDGTYYVGGKFGDLMYDIYESVTSIVVKNTGIYLPSNSMYLFADCTSLTTLDISNLDTSKVTNMNYMFSNCSSLTTLDVSKFTTSNVTDMSYMFYDCKGLTTLDVSKFTTSNVTDMSYMFYDCKALTTLDVSKFDTSQVTDMKKMFDLCKSLTTLDLSNFNTSKVTNMSRMFAYCSSLTTLDLSNFDTSQVTSMSGMFYMDFSSNLTTLDISSFNTSKVTDMSFMFYYCSKLTTLDVSKFDTSKVTNMSCMFFICSKLTTLDVSKFVTSNVTDMSYMFYECSSLTTLDVSSFNTSQATTMICMFDRCSSLTTLDLSNFNTSQVTSMGSIFYYCKSLTTLDLSNFNTSQVTDMSYMFKECYKLTTIKIDTSKFNTSQVTNMKLMFAYCYKLTTVDVSKFDTSSVTTMFYMFRGCSSLTTLDLSNFNTSQVTDMNYMFGDCTGLKTLNISSFDMSNVTDTTDILTSCTSLTTLYTPKAYSSQTVTLPSSYYNGSNTIDTTVYTSFTSGTFSGYVKLIKGTRYEIGDGVYGDFDDSTKSLSIHGSGTIDYSYSISDNTVTMSGRYSTMRNAIKSSVTSIVVKNTGIYLPADSSYIFWNLSNLTTCNLTNLNTSNVTDMRSMFYNCTSLTTLDVSSFTTSKVTDMRSMFYNCTSLTTLDVSKFTTSNVTDMNRMFYNCSNLTTLNISSFNTSKVTNMSYMFYKCSSLTTLDVSIFNTSQVTNMQNMFSSCKKLTTIDLSNFNTSNVTNLQSFFDSSGITKVDISNFDTSKVTTIKWMFSSCSSLKEVKLGNMNTSNVTNMQSVFNNCKNLESVDVSKFNTSNVTTMYAMFYNCQKLTTLDLSNFYTSQVTTMYNMFNGCIGLTTLNISSFDMSKVTVTTDMLTSCTSLTTLFTPKTYSSEKVTLPDSYYNVSSPTDTTQYTEFTSGTFSDSVKLVKVSTTTYTLTVKPNGGTWSSSTSNQTFSIAIKGTKTIANPTRTGYTFGGWTVSGEGSGISGTTFYMGDENATLTAKWTAITYTVQYNGNGSTSGSTSSSSHTYDVAKNLTANGFSRAYTVTYNHNYSGSTNTTKTATYSFAGWATTSTGSKVYDDKASVKNLSTTNGATVNLYAVWTSASVTYVPTRTGYTFGGWYKEAACTNSVAGTDGKYTPTANITLYAKWTAITYTVKYDGNGSTSGSTASSSHTYDTAKNLTANGFTRAYTVTYNHNYTGSSNTTKTATYSFAGWATTSTGSKAYDDKASVKNLSTTNGATVNLYALWTSASVTYVPTRTGYTFAGWYTESACTTSATGTNGVYTPTANITLYAKWTINSYKVTYDYSTNGGTSSTKTEATVNYNSVIDLTPTATKSGWTFVGWNTNKDATTKLDSSTMGTSAVTLYAIYKKDITVTVKYYNNQTSTETKTIYNTATSTSFTLPTIASQTVSSVTYTGRGYSESATANATVVANSGASVTLSADKTYYANYSAEITGTFYYYSGTAQTSTTAKATRYMNYTGTYVNSNYTVPTATTLSGYTQRGWSTGTAGTSTITSTPTTENTSYYMSYTYTVTLIYNANGGSLDSVPTQTGTAYMSSSGEKTGASITITTAIPTRTGYTFGNAWNTAQNKSGTSYTKNTAYSFTSSATLYAEWTANTDTAYVVKHWQQNVGADATQNSTNYTVKDTENKKGTSDSKVTPAVQTYTGFTSPEAQEITISADGTTVLNYYYTRKSYSVTLNKGTGITAVTGAGTYQYGASVTIDATVANGYTCSGWSGTHSTTTKQYTFTMPASNVTDTANTTINSYTLTVNPNKGTWENSTESQNFTLNYLETKTIINPSREGYTFAGWTLTGTASSIKDSTDAEAKSATFTMGYENATLTANWTANTYTIKYNGNGATEGSTESSSHTYDEEKALTANGFERTYTIIYHHNYSGSEDTSKVSTYTFAGWANTADGEKAYDNEEKVVNLASNTGDVVNLYAVWNSETITYAPTRTGYTFVGWYTDAECTNSVSGADGAYTPTEDVVLYAKWEINSYKVTYNYSENGGTGVTTAEATVNYHSAIDLNDTATKTGWTFIGWNTDKDAKEALHSLTMEAEDVTVYAIYKKNITATVKYYNGQTSSETKTIYNKETNTNFTLPEIASQTVDEITYTGRGYSESTTANESIVADSTKEVTLSENKTYYANYSAEITGTFYYYNGSEQTESEATATRYMNYMGEFVNTNYELPEITQLEGYTQRGWSTSTDSSAEIIDAPTTEHTIYYMSYTYPVTITYDANEGTLDSIPTQKATAHMNSEGTKTGTSITITNAIPTRIGYTFGNEWNTNETKTGTSFTRNVAYKFTSDVTLYAEWEADTDIVYVIKHWIQNIGAESEENDTNYTLKDTESKKGTADTVVTPAIQHYTGFTSPEPQSITIAADGSTVLNYYYTRNSYTVTLTKDNGITELTGAKTYEYEESVTIDATVADGYTWSGWTGTHTENTKQYTFTMPASDVKDKANTTINAYTLTVNPNGGTWDDNTSETDFTLNYLETKTIHDPSKTGYTFAGWTLTGTASTLDGVTFTMGYENVSLTANWTANTYTVKYNGNGATSGETADSEHTYDEAKTLTANGFERKYTVTYNHNYSGSEDTTQTATYTFAGWANGANGAKTHDDEESVKNLSTVNGATVNLYALWTSARVTYIPTRTGYTFKGWYSEPECTNNVSGVNGVYTPASDVTLYAKWQANNYAYTVNYLEKDTDKVLHEAKVDSSKSYGTTISASSEVIDIFGYKHSSSNDIVISENEENNVMNIYYVVDEDQTKELSYTVEYYKDGEKVEADTQVEKIEVQVLEPDTMSVNKRKINLVDKYLTYELASTEPVEIPEVVESGTVIKVYYVFNPEKTEYKIEYYYDNVINTAKSEVVLAKVGDTVSKDDIAEKIEANKVDGYRLVATLNTPLTVSEDVENNVIKVHYAKEIQISENPSIINEVGYKIEYYYDNVLDTTKSEVFEAEENTEITSEMIKENTEANKVDGYNLVTILNTPLVLSADVDNNVIKVHYMKEDVVSPSNPETPTDPENPSTPSTSSTTIYKIEYYYDNEINTAKSEVVLAKVGDKVNQASIKSNIEANKIDGYNFITTLNTPLVVSEDVENNVIKVHYIKEETTTTMYKVEYYYNNVIDREKSEAIFAKVGDTISQDSIEAKIEANKVDGYKLVTVLNAPLEITENVENNVIKVHYIKETPTNPDNPSGSETPTDPDNPSGSETPTNPDEPLSEVVPYEVEYYYNGIKDNSLTEMLYVAKDNGVSDETIADKVEINKPSNFISYTVLNDSDNSIIKVYYIVEPDESEKTTYTIEYYYDDVLNADKTEKVTAVKGDLITADKLSEKATANNIDGYMVSKEENVPLVITENAEENIIRIYYNKDNFNYRVEYYYDNKLDETLTETGKAEYLSVISKYEEKQKEGYLLNRVENYPLTISSNEDNNVIQVYYNVDLDNVKVVSYDIVYYKDDEIVDTNTISQYVQILSPDEIEVDKSLIETDKYEDANFVKTDPEEIPEIVESGSTINVYYEIKTSQVVVKYVDKVSGEEIDTETLEGKYGTEYTLEAKEIENYTLLESPEESTGTFLGEDKEYTYYYAKTAEVVVEYLEQDNTPDDTTDNLVLSDKETILGYEGKEYETTSREIENYELISIPSNSKGTMKARMEEVIYYYVQKTKVTVNCIDILSGETIDTERIDGKVGDSYSVVAKDLEGYILIEQDDEGNSILPENTTGTMTKAEIVINYYYKHISAGVIEKHIDKISGEILENTAYEGNEGDAYTTSSKEFEGYDLVEKDSEGNSMLPENASGTMTQDLIEIKYYYIRKTSVKVEYIERNTKEKLAETVVIEGHEEDEYTSEEKEIANYYIVESMRPANAEGTMKVTVNEDGTVNTETIVIYYYAKKSAGVIESHVDERTDKILEDNVYEGLEGDAYTTSSKEFEGYDLDERILPENAEGTMGSKLIEVKYYYLRKTSVKVEYIDEITGKVIEDETEYIYGHEGDFYRTEVKTIEGYRTDEEKLAENAIGTMKIRVDEEGNEITETVVRYYYIRKATVRVQYVDNTTGKKIAEDTVIDRYQGDYYKVEPKEIKDYNLLEKDSNGNSKLPTNAEGTMQVIVNEDGTVETEILVTYYYEKVKTNNDDNNSGNNGSSGNNGNNGSSNNGGSNGNNGSNNGGSNGNSNNGGSNNNGGSSNNGSSYYGGSSNGGSGNSRTIIYTEPASQPSNPSNNGSSSNGSSSNGSSNNGSSGSGSSSNGSSNNGSSNNGQSNGGQSNTNTSNSNQTSSGTNTDQNNNQNNTSDNETPLINDEPTMRPNIDTSNTTNTTNTTNTSKNKNRNNNTNTDNNITDDSNSAETNGNTLRNMLITIILILILAVLIITRVVYGTSKKKTYRNKK